MKGTIDKTHEKEGTMTADKTRLELFQLLHEPPNGWGDEEHLREAFAAFERDQANRTERAAAREKARATAGDQLAAFEKALKEVQSAIGTLAALPPIHQRQLDELYGVEKQLKNEIRACHYWQNDARTPYYGG